MITDHPFWIARRPFARRRPGGHSISYPLPAGGPISRSDPPGRPQPRRRSATPWGRAPAAAPGYGRPEHQADEDLAEDGGLPEPDAGVAGGLGDGDDRGERQEER